MEFAKNVEIELEVLGDISRKVLSYNENLMVVEVNFKTGAIGQMHEHVHDQITYCIKGKFRYFFEDKEYILEKGDSVSVLSNLKHGIECIEEGVVLDIFSPMREDFI